MSAREGRLSGRLVETRQIAGNLVPRGLRRHEDVIVGSASRIVVEGAEGNHRKVALGVEPRQPGAARRAEHLAEVARFREPPGPERVFPAGPLDDDPRIRPAAHIYAKWKAPWHTIADSLPRHEIMPGRDAPRVEEAEPPPPTDGTLHGSCLCGNVAYEVTGEITKVHNCHCSRCRKARAAAHTTNGFTAMDGVRYTRGDDTLRTWRLPEARYFSQVFCPTCGSGMPRLDPERGIAVIPFGSLDDDPGRGADNHIFVASKAPWHEIADDLPRFDEAPG